MRRPPLHRRRASALRTVPALIALALLRALPAAAAADDASDAELRQVVTRVLLEVPLIDGHNDVPWTYRERVSNHLVGIDFRDTSMLQPPMHTDLARLRRGGVGAQFWSVYIPANMNGPGAARAVMEQIDMLMRLVETHDELELALTADDIERIHREGRIASLIGMEGGHAIENSLAVLRQLYRLGARYMTLTHSSNDDWADSATDEPQFGGLSRFGEEVVREMNRLGMLVDLSHVSPQTMNDALDIVDSPVIFSHSSAYAITRHARNVPDDVLRRVKENGGVVMITFVPPFINEALRTDLNALSEKRRELEEKHGKDSPRIEEKLQEWRATQRRSAASLGDVADHIDHVRGLIGVDHIGLGSDFDGITSVPTGLEDVSKFPDLLVELLRRGYSEEDVRKICGLNLLRVLRANEATAARLRRERPASDLLFEETQAKAEAPP